MDITIFYKDNRKTKTMRFHDEEALWREVASCFCPCCSGKDVKSVVCRDVTRPDGTIGEIEVIGGSAAPAC